MIRKLLRIGIILGCLLSPFLLWRLWLRHDINTRLAAIRQAGLPTNGKELNEWYQAMPDNRNAALVLTQAFALITNYPDARSNQIWNFKIPTANRQIEPDMLDLLAGFVEMNSAVVAKANEALELPGCRYPADFTLLANTPLPHLAKLNTLATINAYTSILALDRGQFPRASEATEKILALARTLDAEPCAISQLVRLKLFKMALTCLERRLTAGALIEPELSGLEKAFGRMTITNGIITALIGERAWVGAYFQLSKAEAERLSPAANQSSDTERGPFIPSRGPVILRLSGFYDLDFGQFLLTMNTNITLAARSPREQLKAAAYFQRAGEHSSKRYRTVSATTLPLFSGTLVRGVDAQAFLSMAMTGLAIERFRNEHHQFPETLEELVPTHFPEVPVDPFSRESDALQYKRTEQGYVLYSIGRDQKDDGGLEETDKKKSNDGTSFDLVFRVGAKK